MNQVAFIGRIGSDAELRYTPGGTPVTNVNVAVDLYKGKDRDKETLWVKVVLWANQAEAMAQYLTKGKQIGVSGELTGSEAWASKQDGTLQSRIVVTARNITFCGSKPEGGQSQQPQERQKVEPNLHGQEITDEDIPF